MIPCCSQSFLKEPNQAQYFFEHIFIQSEIIADGDVSAFAGLCNTNVTWPLFLDY